MKCPWCEKNGRAVVRETVERDETGQPEATVTRGMCRACWSRLDTAEQRLLETIRAEALRSAQ